MVLATASLDAFSSLALELEWDGFNRPIVSCARGFMLLIARSFVTIVVVWPSFWRQILVNELGVPYDEGFPRYDILLDS